MKRYGLSDQGTEIVAQEGWKLLPEGEYIPPVHMEAKEDGAWCMQRRCQSTMTPIYARVSGYVRAFAVPSDYQIVPEGATDYLVEELESEFPFGRSTSRVVYYHRFQAFGMSLLKAWNGREWNVVGTLPWDRLAPIEQRQVH